MKKICLFYATLLLALLSLNAQIVTITGSCNSTQVDGDYVLSADVNGKPSFTNSCCIIQWTGSRWEHNPQGSTDVGMYNNLDTANPPASSLSEWTPDSCNPAGTFSGDGTSTSLSINDFELQLELILYPNPSREFIFISGLIENENYRIYNILGTEIKRGIVSNKESIDIRNFRNGLFFLKFNNGYTIKFIKE